MRAKDALDAVARRWECRSLLAATARTDCPAQHGAAERPCEPDWDSVSIVCRGVVVRWFVAGGLLMTAMGAQRFVAVALPLDELVVAARGFVFMVFARLGFDVAGCLACCALRRLTWS